MTKEQAIKHFGTQQELAKALKIKQPAIAQWPDPIPELREFQIREILQKRKNKAKGGK